MDKKQRLRVKTPDTSINASVGPKHDMSSVDFTRDSSIHIPPRISTDETGRKSSEVENKEQEPSFDFEISLDASPILQKASVLDSVRERVISFILGHWVSGILLCVIVYLTLKPSEYKFLLDEIESLKKENTVLLEAPVRNIAELTQGTRVTGHSELYRFGFFRNQTSDPNSIFDTGSECLALKGSTGTVEIGLGIMTGIRKIALYHSSNANPGSALRDFTVKCGNREYNFSYKGQSYEEFHLDDAYGDSVVIEVQNNHGEVRYTCIYRIFVFA